MNYADRLKQQTTSTGTGNLTLGNVPAGYLSLDGAFVSPGRFLYVIQDQGPGQWEIGWGYVSAGALVRETPIAGSGAKPVSFGAGIKDIFVAHNANLSTGMHMALFGSGVAGDSNITTSVAQGGDGHYENLTISGAGKIDAAGHRILVRGVLDLQNCSQFAINNNGENGTAAVLDALGPSGQGGLSGTLGAGTSGGNGANGTTGVGAQGSAAAALLNANGGKGGAGGAGGHSGGANAGGASKSTGGVSGSQTPGIFDSLVGDAAGTGVQILGGGTGGAGGSAGGGDAGAGKGGGGGGAGGGGGVLEVRAAMLVLGNDTAAASAIAAVGGVGARGGDAAGGTNPGGGGGSGGGAGGYVRLIVGYVRGSKSQLVAAFGGYGGDGGSGQGDGSPGDGGNGGNGGTIDIWNLEIGTMVRTNGLSGQPNSGSSGGLGGDCYGDL